MSIYLKIFYESAVQAVQQLLANKLRSFLSLLGITIGIFCIVGVQSAVDSLEADIRNSFERLGSDVLYINVMPWNEDPGRNFWKYQRRPVPSYTDFKALKKRLTKAYLVDYQVFIGPRSVKWRNNFVERTLLASVTYDFAEIFQVEFQKGRYFTPSEYHYGMNRVLIGHKVAQELFGDVDPIGKQIKLMGQRVEVIGVFAPSGKSLINVLNFDQSIIVGYPFAKKVANLDQIKSPFGIVLIAKAAPGTSLEALKDEVTMVLRSVRKLKPKEENNFALNSLSLIAQAMDAFFGAMSTAGWFIGIFAIFVGAFSVANIMFVSVKERTSIIGIKKALGAKKMVILLEFLIESVILCLIGGVAGLIVVAGTLYLLSGVLPFEVFLNLHNIALGVGLSVLIGVLSGIIPAGQAARLDPVVAIRS